MFPNLEQIKNGNVEVVITSASEELVREVQTLLQLRRFYKLRVDGIPGPATQEGLSNFKKSVWLENPFTVGSTTAAALLEITEDHKFSEQLLNNTVKEREENGNTKSLLLVTGERVFASQFVVPGVPLTWGDITKGCAPERNPESKQIIENIIFTAEKFGAISKAFDSPIGITSAYRTPTVNARVGGARRSQHIEGLALDIYPLNGEMSRLWQVCQASDVIGLGDGRRRGFIHLDWRNRGRGVRTVFNY